MAKNYSNRNRKRKALIAMLCALSVTCTGLAAACAPTEEEEPSTAVTAKEDVQLLKNGNFEHFDIPDKAVHLIKNVNSWSLGGDTSVKSGIIGTSKSDWDKLTDPELASTLDYNNDLATDNEEYVNYNSMRSRDILYRDTYAAQLEKVEDSWMTKHDDGHQGYLGVEGNEDDGYTWNGEEAKLLDGEFYIKDDDGNFTKLIRKELIENPETHWGKFTEEDGEYKFGGKKAYQDENGNYYFDEDMETDPVGNVLMIHNGGVDSDNKSYHQYYTSNTITLEAHTSAEISLWVKTSDLKFGKGYFATAEQEDKGAYIEVIQSVANKSIDSFKIKAINTENIISSAKEKGVTTTESNGWIQYSVYVNACDFANTSIQLRLGLGGSDNNEKVTGYAFFDDVQVKKYRDLSKDENYADAKVENTTCTLNSEKEDKIFYADVNTKNPAKDGKLRAYDFDYKIDLASITDSDNQKNTYYSIAFGENVKVGLTTEKDSKGKEYAAAKNIDANTKIEGVGTKEQTADFNLPKDLKDKARPTSYDVIMAFDKSHKFEGDYAAHLNNLTGDDNGAPGLPAEGNHTLVMFSAWGAPYTATLKDDNTFKIAKDDYLLVSFWVKTSDMDGGTAATAKIYELNKKGFIDEESVKTLTVDTTDKTTDFEDDKDIYNGWVQCFFFVQNNTDDEKTFQIDFSFGTTAITTTTSYASGYAAIANLQTLEIDEDIYKLASSSDTTALFSFSKETEKDKDKTFDEANATSDIDKGIALPSNYTGVKGGKVLGNAVDKTLSAGLINRDNFKDYSSELQDKILSSFMTGATEWSEVFGDSCYQPLIIINNLNKYASEAKANENTFNNGTYWIQNKDGTYTNVSAIEDAKFEDYDKYYTLSEVANYGFIGEEKTVSSNGREVVSVRVKVTGDAVAYIYLLNSDDTNEILNYTTPAYTYWYDEEGNVLDEELNEEWTTAEHREHIAYTLREDGLYEDKDGKLFANLMNLVKSYKDGKYESAEYYDENGKPIAGGYDYVEKHDGETFYKADGTIADHYLCATDGTHVYEYIDGKYYYVEITKTDDKTTETTNLDKEVTHFETTPRYTNPEIAEELFVTVTKDDCIALGDKSDLNLSEEAKKTAPGWVTVNFVINAGSEAKDYRLALWSGDRNSTGVKDGEFAQGAVAFDYVHGTVSANRLTAYENEIINAYDSAFAKHALDVLKEESSLGRDANIADYEAILNSDKLTDAQKADIKAEMKALGYVDADGNYTYKASYYTYTLYDSAAYVPFNATTAGDGETGYNYDASSFSEQLAYFEFEDTAQHQKNVFVDYSAVDQSISKNTVDNDDDDEEEETDNNSAELGLYISSIVLVVVLLITLISILLTQYIRKRRKASGKKNTDKNAYRKRDRYVKKLHLVKDEIVEPENDASEASDVPAEEVTPVENEVTEVPAEETTETAEPAEGEDKE